MFMGMQMINKYPYGSLELISGPEESIEAMEMCVSDARKLMLAKLLMTKDSKTEAILMGKRQQLSKV